MRPDWLDTLRLPVMIAPMYIASGPELVIAGCRGGLAAAFPALNPGSPEALDSWFADIAEALAETPAAGPYGVNLILMRGAFEPLLEVCKRRKPKFVITSVGAPGPVVDIVHDWGGAVFHDVTTLRHAEKAIEAGVDGIVVVCAGAGGHAGAVNPFALLPQIRAIFDGVIILAGALTDGRSILAAQMLGADLVYMGTRFLATREARVSDAYKAMIVESSTQDIVYTPCISGLPANFMRKSIADAGLDPANLPQPTGPHQPNLPSGVRAWSDVWSAGQGAGLITDVPATSDLITRLADEYRRAAGDVSGLASSPSGGSDRGRRDRHVVGG